MNGRLSFEPAAVLKYGKTMAVNVTEQALYDNVQAHGATTDVSAAGQGVNGVTTAVNPDGLSGEGAVATIGKKLLSFLSS